MAFYPKCALLVLISLNVFEEKIRPGYSNKLMFIYYRANKFT